MSKKSHRAAYLRDVEKLPHNVEVTVLGNDSDAASAPPLNQGMVDGASDLARRLGPNWTGTIKYNAVWNVGAVCRRGGKIALTVTMREIDLGKVTYDCIVSSDGAARPWQGWSGCFRDPRDAVLGAVLVARRHIREAQGLLDRALSALI